MEINGMPQFHNMVREVMWSFTQEQKGCWVIGSYPYFHSVARNPKPL
jgi:hypothetical protein